MVKELKQFEALQPETIVHLSEDQDCASYAGFNFQLGNRNIKFRKAKITPKKTGQFVTYWKRDSQGQTIPFTIDDEIDYYLIAVEQEQQLGFFVFPKQVLIDREILTTARKEGKRGFRVYPDWSIAENKQAIHSKNWQGRYFINLSPSHPHSREKLAHILGVS